MMAPTGKWKPEAQGPAPAPPLLECTLSKDVDLAPVLPWTEAESNEDGRTLIWPSAIEKRPTSKVVYPFFLHRAFAELVSPFSSFFTAILSHYGIQALHLQPVPTKARRSAAEVVQGPVEALEKRFACVAAPSSPDGAEAEDEEDDVSDTDDKHPEDGTTGGGESSRFLLPVFSVQCTSCLVEASNLFAFSRTY
ncbi:hypothetical protein D1007_25484 [Hordeum vulgare]|nr:hypothetical protein D1007_25484 [Hordeum vulgare]